MTTKRLIVLLAVLLGGLSTVFLIPKQLGFQPVGLKLELPAQLGPWTGTPVEITEKEHTALGADTEFARMSYQKSGGERVLVSIVLAGQDMMTGLHRPERCLLAQGWNPGGFSRGNLPLEGGRVLPYTRLRNSRKLPAPAGQAAPTLENICYYWFVGATDILGSHEQRVRIDMRDRILRGYNQRWAMILVAGEITDRLIEHGRNEARTDEAVQDVIRRFFPEIVTIKS